MAGYGNGMRHVTGASLTRIVKTRRQTSLLLNSVQYKIKKK